MSENDTLTQLLGEFGSAFESLGEAIESVENFELYARELGWSVTSIPPAIQALAPPLRALSNELAAGTLDASTVPKVFGLLRAVIEGVNAIQGASAGDLPQIPGFATEFPQQVLDRTIVDYLVHDFPVLAAALRMLGVAEIEPVPAAAGRPAYISRKVNWAAMSASFSSPLATLDALYSWSTGFEVDRFLRNLRYLLDRCGVFVRSGALPDAVASSLFAVVPADGIAAVVAQVAGDRRTRHGLRMGARVAPTPDSPGLAVVPYAQGAVGAQWDITEEISLQIRGESTFAEGFAVVLRPGEDLQFVRTRAIEPAAALDTAMSVGVDVKPGGAGRRVLLGTTDGSRVDLLSISGRLGGRFSSTQGPALFAEADLRKARVVIALSSADAFLARTLPAGGLILEFDVTAGLSSESGFYFGGSGGLEVQIPTHIEIGPLEIQGALLALKLDGGSFVLDTGATVSADLAVLKATIENVGLRTRLRFAADGTGNLGPLDLDFDFKPPTGVGLSIDAAIVKGGGFLRIDAKRGEYSGAIELSIAEIVSVNAIGLITTKMPDGSKGFSLLIIITAEFGSGIQLGFGFTLLGVGGLLGVNRTTKLQAISDGVRTGAIDRVMFPKDVVANAPKIISDLRAYFPPKQDTFLIGPMAKLGWGTPTLISLSLGIIIEIPPGNVAILGVLKVELPADDVVVLKLQVSFIGALEFDKKRVWFFASLHGSRLLFINIEGEMGLLMAYGNDPDFVVSVGGFHPRFKPPPLPFPNPKRVVVPVVNTPVARVTVKGYFAVTTNTVQFGARADAFFGLSAVNVSGHISFDALFQFSPFFFEIRISASFSVKVFGIGLFSVRIRGSLEGPTPWRARGEGSISFFFFSVSADFDITWGQRKDTVLPPIAVMPLLEAEFKKDESWTALVPSSNKLLVSLRKLDGDTDLVLHPVGVLKVAQRRLPLELKVDKVGNQKPNDVDRLSVKVTGGGLSKVSDAYDKFAPAQFQDMKDDDKLSRPAFGSEKAGLTLSVSGDQVKSSHMVKRVVRYEEIIIDSNYKRFVRRFSFVAGVLFKFFLRRSAIARAEISFATQQQLTPFAEVITVASESYSVVFQATNKAYSSDAVSFASEASARDFLEQQALVDANLAETLQVVPDFEMVS